MEDHNIFAVLTPKDEKNLARSAFHLPENASRFHKATRSADSRPRIDCQEPNSPLSIQSDGGEVARWNASDRIILTFDQPPKNPSIGWQFGTSKTSSDVLLGNRRTEGISAQQCRITVDQKGWIFLHDDCSLDGTGVDYDHKKYDEELGETWILAQGPGFRIRWKEITIHAGCLAFRIEFPNHQAGDPKYRDNIRCLFQNSQAALSPFNGLIPSATVPGMAYQGGRGARYMIRKKIGQGGFGRTYHAINLRNGLEYAVKDFIPPKGNDDCEWKEWREMIVNETRIMWNNLHPNVMRALDYAIDPRSLLIMPYYPDGDLRKAIDDGRLTDHHVVSVLGQTLSGLQYLHGEGIVHRDIKPENILVQFNKGTVLLVITDFGLSKISTGSKELLRSICGTPHYMAPETILYPECSGYRANVDIWAAGVTVCDCIWNFPKSNWPATEKGHAALAQWYKKWMNVVLKRLVLKNKKDPRLIGMISHMLVIEPENRFSARRCLQVGCGMGLFKACSDGSIVDNVECVNARGDVADGCGKRTPDHAKKPPSAPLEDSKVDTTGVGTEEKATTKEAWAGEIKSMQPRQRTESQPRKDARSPWGGAPKHPRTRAHRQIQGGAAKTTVKAPPRIHEAIDSLLKATKVIGSISLTNYYAQH